MPLVKSHVSVFCHLTDELIYVLLFIGYKKSMSALKIKKFGSQEGFTLIELLVVIGILAILLAITLIAINPSRQFEQANDTKRRSAATQILNAIGAYMADHGGQYPTALADPTDADLSSAGVNLCASLLPDYMPALPQDPTINNGADITACPAAPATYDTGYHIVRAGGRITVSNTHSTNGTVISVSR